MNWLKKIFTDNGWFLAHYCGALSHCTFMACCLYYSWLINIIGGGFFAWPIAAIVTFVFCYWKEKTDKTGFSKSDIMAGVLGIITSLVLFVVIVNIKNGA